MSSILKQINKREFWTLSDVGGHDLRDEYELRTHLFEMIGFNVASLREKSTGDDDELKQAYDDFTERVRRLLELQLQFITIDREKDAVEAKKIESMLFDPARADDTEKLLRAYRENFESTRTKGGEEASGVIPLGLPGEELPEIPDMTDTDDEELTRARIAEKLVASTPINEHDEGNYMLPEITSELIEETY